MNEETKKLFSDEINNLIQSRKKDICSNYPIIRKILRSSYEGDAELNPLRQEISICIVFGLYQAAITLTNHLLEKFLKIALIYKNADFTADGKTVVEKVINSTAKSIKTYKKQYLGKNIEDAYNQGILTEEERNRLNDFRHDFRNAYGHADVDKTFKDKSIPLWGVNFDEKGPELEEMQVEEVSKLPVLQGFVQLEHAKAYAIPYFRYLDNLIRKKLPQIFNDHKEQPLS